MLRIDKSVLTGYYGYIHDREVTKVLKKYNRYDEMMWEDIAYIEDFCGCTRTKPNKQTRELLKTLTMSEKFHLVQFLKRIEPKRYYPRKIGDKPAQVQYKGVFRGQVVCFLGKI